jgi:hypothetical protein
MKNRIYKKRVGSLERLAQERTILDNEINTLAYVGTAFASFALGLS